MRTTSAEQTRAEQVSASIDSLLRESEGQSAAADPLGTPGTLDPADAGLLDTAQQLARLPALLGPVNPALEQQVVRRARQAAVPERPRFRFRLGWAAAGLAAILLAVTFLTPQGQTALAGFMAVFDLGRTEVRITPVNTPSTLLGTATAGQDGATREPLSLEEAQALFPVIIPQPAHLPAGYSLHEIGSYTYPDLPAWIPQPFFIELVYAGTTDAQAILRVYPIMLGDHASISGLNLEAAPIQGVQDVDINGQAGVLLQLGTEEQEIAWQEVVWEHGDLILALYATDLTQNDLLRMARSVQ
jgi:hypothetical protein